MAEYSLRAQSPLKGVSQQYDGVAITEVIDRAIVCVAVPNGGQENLQTTLTAAYNLDIPRVGTAAHAAGVDVLGLTQDQFFILFTGIGHDPADDVRAKIGDSGYLVDQSDSWVVVHLSGPRCREMLERICPIDLHDDAFPIGTVARTVMEHLATIIYRNENGDFTLLSARSSAASFLHALEVSAKNVS